MDFGSLLAAVKKFCELHECAKTKLTCLRGTRKAIFSASLLAECNTAFPFNKTAGGISTLYIEKIALNYNL